MPSNISKKKPSFTAMVQAGIRYAGSFESYGITDDQLGYLFLDHPYKMFSSPSTHSALYYLVEREWPGGFGYSCCRSLVGDMEFKSFEGDQIVNLGAGFCTRVERFAEQAQRCKVFELDLTPSQQKKMRIMKEHCPTAYSITNYLSVDFEKESIADVLLSSDDFDGSAQSLFFWEGVSMYIDAAAVDQVFRFVHENSGLGSLIVFDYVFLDYIESKGKSGGYHGGDKVFKAANKKNEPFLFGIANGGVEEWLKQRGFSMVKHWTGEELEEQFLTAKDGQIKNRAAGPLCVCVARVEKTNNLKLKL